MSYLSIKYVSVSVASILTVLLLVLPGHAETETNDAWHFQIATYAWMSGQKGTLATQPGLPAADVDIDFYDDILGNINGSFALIGEARNGRVGVVTDVSIRISKTTMPPPARFSRRSPPGPKPGSPRWPAFTA